MLEIRFRRNRSFQTMFNSLFAPAFRLIGWDSVEDSALTLLVNGRSRSLAQFVIAVFYIHSIEYYELLVLLNADDKSLLYGNT